jgi:hypothetical protein
MNATPSQVQRVPGKVTEAKPGEVHLAHGKPAEVCLPSTLQKDL